MSTAVGEFTVWDCSCGAKAVVPITYTEADPFDVIVHQPWCSRVRPTRPIAEDRL